MLFIDSIISNTNSSNILSLLTRVAHWFFGTKDDLLLALATFIIIDFFTSILCFTLKGKFSRYAIRKSVYKSITLFLLVGVSHVVDAYLVGSDNTFRTITIEIYIIYEGIAILENASCLGVPIPKPLEMFLKNLFSDRNKTK